MGRPDLVADARFVSADEREHSHDDFDGVVAEWTRTLSADGDRRCPRRTACAGRAGNDRPTGCTTSHSSTNVGYYEEFEHPVTGRHRYPGWPFTMTPGPDSPPPIRAADTRAAQRRDSARARPDGRRDRGLACATGDRRDRTQRIAIPLAFMQCGTYSASISAPPVARGCWRRRVAGCSGARSPVDARCHAPDGSSTTPNLCGGPTSALLPQNSPDMPSSRRMRSASAASGRACFRPTRGVAAAAGDSLRHRHPCRARSARRSRTNCGGADAVLRRCGSVISAQAAGPKLAWIRAQRTRRLGRIPAGSSWLTTSSSIASPAPTFSIISPRANACRSMTASTKLGCRRSPRLSRQGWNCRVRVARDRSPGKSPMPRPR